MKPFRKGYEGTVEFPSKAQDLMAAIYHGVPALNASIMGSLLDCPAMAVARLFSPPPPTDAMKLGTLVHTLVLEPEKADRRYVRQSLSGATKAGKAEIEEIRRQGKEAVSPSMWKNAEDMAMSVRNHPAIGKLLACPGESELSLFWRREVYGYDPIDCKGRVDRVCRMPSGQIVAFDLKTSITANPKDLGRKMCDFGYHRQAAWYLEGLRAVGIEAVQFVFGFVRNQWPFLAVPIMLDEEALRLGERECDHAAHIWADCIERGEWPSYSDEIVTVRFPPWAFK